MNTLEYGLRPQYSPQFALNCVTYKVGTHYAGFSPDQAGAVDVFIV